MSSVPTAPIFSASGKATNADTVVNTWSTSLDFGIISIDVELVGKYLSEFVRVGSNRYNIADTDLAILTTDATPAHFVSVNEALEKGTKLFDALYYFAQHKDKRKMPVNDPQATANSQIGMRKVASALFYVYFFLLTRAQVPSGTGVTPGKDVPNFLFAVMGLQDPPQQYAETLASFKLSQADHRWIESVRTPILGQEAISRIGLGVAGYRLLAPFKLYPRTRGMAPNVERAARLAEAIAKADADWSIHPITRDPGILNRLGNLNKNLANLLLDAYTPEEIDEMVKAKAIFEKPNRDIKHTNYLSWFNTASFALTKPIFHDPATGRSTKTVTIDPSKL